MRSARRPRNGCCHSSSDHGPEINSGGSDLKWRWCLVQGGDCLQHALIPYLSRTTSETKGWRPETTGNSIRRSAFLFRPGAGHRLDPDHALKGGDTGSNPVGTTSKSAGQERLAQREGRASPRRAAFVPQRPKRERVRGPLDRAGPRSAARASGSRYGRAGTRPRRGRCCRATGSVVKQTLVQSYGTASIPAESDAIDETTVKTTAVTGTAR